MASCGIVSSVSPAHPPRPPVPFCSPATPSCISCQSDGSAQFPSFSAQPTSPHLSACFQTAGLPRQEEGEVPGHCSSLRARRLLACSACQNSGGSNHFLCLFLPFLSPIPYLPFCLPLLLFSVSPLPIPPLSSPSVLVFLSPSLGPDSYGFQVPHSYFRYNKTEARRGSQ